MPSPGGIHQKLFKLSIVLNPFIHIHIHRFSLFEGVDLVMLDLFKTRS